jgi:hypothetical protein
MSNKFAIVSKTLSGDLAASGTTTFSYPTNTDEDSFAGYGHKAVGIGNIMSSPGDFTLTFGSASITFTYAASKTTIPAGTVLTLELNLPAEKARTASKLVPDHPGVSVLTLVRVDLGSPLTSDPNGISEASSPTGTGNLTLGGALASDGVVDLTTGEGATPFGRNVSVDSGGADDAVITVTGTDWEGNAMSENILANGTTIVYGKKAFATITQCAHSKTIANGLFVGTYDTLGLPFYLPGIDDCPVVFEYEDNILKANPGTFLAGVDTVPTATTGDVRGTYLPVTSLPDGAQNFVLFIPSTDPTYQGQAQYTP